MIAKDIEFRRLSPIAGAEVLGLDLREPLTEDADEALRIAWMKYGLLVFRDQQLDKDQHLNFLRTFGDVYTAGRSTSRKGISDGVSYVSNIEEYGVTEFGVGELTFHRDTSFYEKPARGITLHAVELPPPGSGGDTLFVHQGHAYRKLPLETRNRIDKLIVRHGSKVDDKHPVHDVSEHPLGMRHRATGEPLIFMSRRHVEDIGGLPESERKTLVEELTPYMESPEFQYRHVWKTGDLVMWDNILFLHARTDFDASTRRYLRRILIA